MVRIGFGTMGSLRNIVGRYSIYYLIDHLGHHNIIQLVLRFAHFETSEHQLVVQRLDLLFQVLHLGLVLLFGFFRLVQRVHERSALLLSVVSQALDCSLMFDPTFELRDDVDELLVGRLGLRHLRKV